MPDYFDELNGFNENEKLVTLRTYGEENGVPIITMGGLSVLLSVIRIKNVKKILEIGTAIGYSSIVMALEDEGITIDTIERDKKMYDQAVLNVKDFGLENRINIIYKDALEVDVNELGKYDLIFIDAAKAQYIKFFEKYSPLLSDNGVIYTDNLMFHGLVETKQEDIESRNLRALVRKINNFNVYLKNNQEFNTTFIKYGDGIALSVKKK